MQTIQPSCASSKHKAGRAGVRNYAGGKCQRHFLSCCVHVTKQTAAAEMRPASLRIDTHLAHWRKIDHESLVARAEPRQAVAAAANRGNNARGRTDTHRCLDVAHIAAESEQTGSAREHSVPNLRRFAITRIGGAQQGSLESATEGSVHILD